MENDFFPQTFSTWHEEEYFVFAMAVRSNQNALMADNWDKYQPGRGNAESIGIYDKPQKRINIFNKIRISKKQWRNSVYLTKYQYDCFIKWVSSDWKKPRTYYTEPTDPEKTRSSEVSIENRVSQIHV